MIVLELWSYLSIMILLSLSSFLLGEMHQFNNDYDTLRKHYEIRLVEK